ncbi:MAG: hypothetical protein JW822_05475 [Spirochaetales bacterium]|nr:hypothetical protein [Spirochaetales bacterium]
MKQKNDKDKSIVRVQQNDLPSNADLKMLIERILDRFENWKMKAETNPNPRLAHSLKNIITLVDSITRFTESKINFSYKNLTRQMSVLIEAVAKLNRTITDALMGDDILDENEEIRVNEVLMEMVRAAVDLIVIVQQSFGINKDR